MLKILNRAGHSVPAQPDQGQDDTLGGFCFSQRIPFMAGEKSPGRTWQHVPMQVLDEQDVLWECFHSLPPVREEQHEDVRYRYDDNILFGIVTLTEAAHTGNGHESRLQVASRNAYAQIFSVMNLQKFPYALRFWNYIADINGITHGLERYRQFNLGRQQAFSADKENHTGNLPAACALGMAQGPLTIAFLAGRTPSLPIENPRQISAYDYPVQYGPSSPLFARASIASIAGARMLFLSGTASIVGHATIHAGNVEAQTEESARNIAAVLGEVGNRTGVQCNLHELEYIVYVRKMADFAAIRATLERCIGDGLKARYVQADICRSDLLVEIEGFAALPSV